MRCAVNFQFLLPTTCSVVYVVYSAGTSTHPHQLPSICRAPSLHHLVPRPRLTHAHTHHTRLPVALGAIYEEVAMLSSLRSRRLCNSHVQRRLLSAVLTPTPETVSKNMSHLRLCVFAVAASPCLAAILMTQSEAAQTQWYPC